MSIGQHDSKPPQTPARILLVDDNLYGLTARKSILEELGYRVTAKPCPKLALECLAAEQFDLVITDYRMPGMDGTEFISRVRTATPTIPVVLISGFTDTLGLNEQGTGANVVIQKSNHEVTLMVHSVERLLGAGSAPRKPMSRQRLHPQHRTFTATAR